MDEILSGFIAALELISSLNPEVVSITLLSLRVSGTAVLIGALLGIPFGAGLAIVHFRGKFVVLSVINTFMSFPPVVMGLLLYLILSQNGPLGDLDLLYSEWAMILAQFLLALPIITGITANAVSSVDPLILEAAKSLGANRIQIDFTMIKEARKSILAGIIVAFGQALSEVGAIMIVGGNVRWRTRTLTTAIVREISRGSPELAIALGLILLIVAFSVNILLTTIQQKETRIPGLKTQDDELLEETDSSQVDFPLSEFFNELPRIDKIILDSISFQYNEKKVLNKISLEINSGEIFCLVGPNGAGKTTFLKIIDQLLVPQSGKVSWKTSFDKNDSREKKNHFNLRKRSCLVHQTPIMFRESVFDNVAFGLRIQKEKQLKEKVLASLRELNLLGLKSKNAWELSVGEMQRVAFARAIASSPSILLLDEVSSHLDPANVAAIENTVKKINSSGVTVILATHNLFQAKRIATRIGFLLNGELVEVQDASKIFESPIDPRTKAFLNGEMVY